MSNFFRKNATLGAAEIICRIPLIFTAGYIARSIGTEAFGIWALIVVYQGFVAAIAGLGMANSVTRFAPSSTPAVASGYLVRALQTAAIMLVCLFAFTWLGRNVASSILGIPQAAEWLLPLTVLLALSGCSEGLLDAYFKATEDITRQIRFLLTRTGAEVAVVLAVFWLYADGTESDPFTLLGIYTVLVVATKLAGYSLLVRARRQSALKLSRTEWRAFLRYGLPLIPVVMIAWFTMQGDRLILGHLVEKQWLGIYAFAASLAYYLSLLGYAVYPLLLPRSSRLHDDNRAQDVQTLFAESQYVLLALLAIALTAISLFAHEIIAYTAGPDFIAAAPILVVLSISVAIEQVFGIYQYVFHLARKTQWILWLNLCYALLLGVAVYAAASLGDPILIPWTIVVVTGGFNLGRYLISRRFLVMRIPAAVCLGLAGAIIAAWSLRAVASEWGALPRLLLVAGVTCAAGIVLNSVMAGRLVLALRALVAR